MHQDQTTTSVDERNAEDNLFDDVRFSLLPLCLYPKHLEKRVFLIRRTNLHMYNYP